mgnify:CR=1 FL=1
MFYRVFRKLFAGAIEKYPFLSIVVFRSRLMFCAYKKSDLLILATVTKTGTHYLRFLISYYLVLVNNKKQGLDLDVSPNQFIIDEFLPNSWHSAYRFFVKRKKPSDLLKHIGIKDIPRSHLRLRDREWKGFKVLHTYRSVADQAVVSYETKYKCDQRISDLYDSPWDLYLETREDNLDQITSFKDQSAKGVNSFRVEFGQIYNHPEKTLALILMWLGEEPDLMLCNKAAELAALTPSIMVGAGEKWQRQHSDAVDRSYLNEFFSKYSDTGAVGCANEYFDEDQLKQANTYCKL